MVSRLAPALLAAGIVLFSASANAQHVVVIVNGEPITNLDVANRAKLNQLSTRQTSPRQEVIDELIDEKLKVHFARRYKLEASDSDVDSSFADMARRMRNTPDGLEKVLTAQGINPYTLKDRIRAEMLWAQIVRGKFQSSMQVSEREVATALEAQRKDDESNSGTEYTLRPILFVVARNAGQGATDARRRDAEALRTRFNDCESGIRIANSLRDTIVRAPIKKSSGELAPVLRDILDKTPVGRLTEPEVTPQGVEIFAVCEKRAVSLDEVAKKKIQSEQFAARFKANSDKLLKSLRAGAMIEYREQTKDTGNAPRTSRNSR